MKRNSKALCLLLAGTMAVTNCPMPVMAAENDGNSTQLVAVENSAGAMANQQLTETVEETELQVSDREDSEAATAEKDLEKGKEELKEETGEIQEISQEVNKADETEKTDAETVEETVDTEEAAKNVVEGATAEKTVETEIEVSEETVNADTTLTKGDFTYTQAEDGSITITDYTGAGGVVNIAKTFAGENVVAIGYDAFGLFNASNRTGKKAISTVILPVTLKSIGQMAFYSCEALSSVTFAEGNPQLEIIGKEAFEGCSALSSITMPETLQSIGERAFYNCYTLGSIIIPSSVPGIPAYAFYNCYSLRRVEMKSKDTVINSSAFSADSGTKWNTIKANLTFYGEADSTAETYAAEKGFRFQRYTDAITLKTPPTKTEYYYGEDLNTAGLTIEADFTSDTEPATAEIDASSCIVSGYNKNKVGTQTITVSYADKTTTFQVKVYYNLENATVDSIHDQTYTGREVTPEVTVTGKETSTTLVKDEDYILEYPDNHTDVGTATVKITGIGKYKGSTTKTFKIAQKSIEGKEISASVPTVTYDGTEKKPVPVIQDGTKYLTEEDYEIISYSSNVNAGTGKVQVQGKGNYKDTLYISFIIDPKDISAYGIKDIPDQIYSQSALTPEVIVPLDEYTNLKESIDYTVRYKDNVEIGTATVSVEGKGNYKGTIEKTFTIKAKSLKDVTVEAVPDQTYTGKAIEPVVSVYDGAYSATLIKGTDYAVTYKDNVNAGTATITIQGIGSYEGTIEKTFEIKPIKLYGLNIEISNMDTCTYTGEAQKPSFKLTYNEDTILTEGTDYTVTYKDNIEAGTGTLVIEGTGNYKGTVEKNFTILPKKLQGITINDLPGYTYTGEAVKPAIDVKMDGVSLVADKDYKVTYSNNVNVGEALVSITGMGNYEGTVEKTFDIKKKSIADIGIRNIANHIYTGEAIEPVVSLDLDVYTTLTKDIDYQITYVNNVNVGTATVQVQGIGNYTGVVEKTFKITPKSLAGSSVVVSGAVSNYTGNPVTPFVTVVSGNRTLIAGTEYTVTYRNNKNIGTATVTINGIGNYTGSLSKNFTIQAKKGSTFIVGAYKYQITSGTEVAFAGLKSSKTTKVTIPTQVKIGGKTFKVTSIANKALKGSAVTSVTIGKNVKTIGTSAFEKCSKLKKITVKTSALKKIGKNAFKGINAKAVIKVPKSKLSAYKKLMKGKGQSKTVKITK